MMLYPYGGCSEIDVKVVYRYLMERSLDDLMEDYALISCLDRCFMDMTPSEYEVSDCPVWLYMADYWTVLSLVIAERCADLYRMAVV